MALRCLVRYCLECSNYKLFRRPQSTIRSYVFYSSSFKEEKANDAPVRYSQTAASKLSAAENLRLHPIKKEKVWLKKYVIGISLTLFILYFCVLREENDVDEILKGNTSYLSDEAKYIDLKIKLSYCQKNNLPTVGLKEKIEELEKKLGKI